jgi:lipid-A-disaccharide synthase
MSKLALRGYVEVLSRIPELAGIRNRLRRRLLRARAPLFIGVDAPDFNLGLEAKLKRSGVRTIHYVSPSVWAWRQERIGTMARRHRRAAALFRSSRRSTPGLGCP